MMHAAPSMLYHASHPQWPSRPPLELAPSGSQIERAAGSVAPSRSECEPSRRRSPQPAAGSRQSPALPPPQQQRASSCVAFCRRSVDARRPGRARGRPAPVNRQPYHPLVHLNVNSKTVKFFCCFSTPRCPGSSARCYCCCNRPSPHGYRLRPCDRPSSSPAASATSAATPCSSCCRPATR